MIFPEKTPRLSQGCIAMCGEFNYLEINIVPLIFLVFLFSLLFLYRKSLLKKYKYIMSSLAIISFVYSFNYVYDSCTSCGATKVGTYFKILPDSIYPKSYVSLLSMIYVESKNFYREATPITQSILLFITLLIPFAIFYILYKFKTRDSSS